VNKVLIEMLFYSGSKMKACESSSSESSRIVRWSVEVFLSDGIRSLFLLADFSKGNQGPWFSRESKVW